MLPTRDVRPIADKIATLNSARATLIEAHDRIARCMGAPTIAQESPERMAEGGKIASALVLAHRDAAAAVELLASIVSPLPATIDDAIGGGK